MNRADRPPAPTAPSPPTAWPVAILAGGLATRLGDRTKAVPKSLLPVAGRPFLDHQLRQLSCQGFQQVVLCLGHLGEAIEAFAGNGSAWRLNIRYSHDGGRLRGTAGALRQALPWLGPRFFVLYGDSYLPIDFMPPAATWLASGQEALMTVFRNQSRFDRSNVLFDGRQILVYDKSRPLPAMEHIDYGLGLLSAAAFRRLPPDDPADLSTLYQILLRDGQLAAHEVQQRFYEIGSEAGLLELDRWLALRIE